MWQLNQQWQKEPLAEKISGLNNKKKPTERETKLGGERERERESIDLFCRGQLGRNRGGVDMK